MSDIVIPNAKLPTNCFACAYEKLTENCPCHIGICSASEYKNSRHPDCPLVEVPPHGDLKDADVIGNWHTGTPTEEGWYLIKYECLVEGRYKGKLTYRAVHIYYDKYGIYNEDGSIGHDEVWKPIEYQIIEQNKETD